MLECIYGLSPRGRLSGPGEPFALQCAYPLQRIEVNESAFRLLSALDGATPLHALVAPGAPVAPALGAFLESLVTRGCLTARYRAVPAFPFGQRPARPAAGMPAQPAAPSIEVVIPVLDNAAGLARCLAALAALDYPRRRWSVTIVDDGSAQPVEPRVGPLPAGLPLLRWIRLPANVGPASARNAALFARGGGTPSALVAFTDSDCVPGVRWLTSLAAAFDEPVPEEPLPDEPAPDAPAAGEPVQEPPGLAAVGGQVRGLSGRGWLAQYEDACASLNLGRAGGPVGAAGDRLSYLPTCNLIARRAALESVGGFTPGLRLGEDVDLMWRMRVRGWDAFYLPGDNEPAGGVATQGGAVPVANTVPPECTVPLENPEYTVPLENTVPLGITVLPDNTVRHEYRDRLVPFLRRKAAYARSEAWLRRRHPAHFAGRAPRIPQLALAVTGAGCLAGGGNWVAGLAAAGALLVAEGAWHGWRRREAARGWPFGSAVAALARRAAAGVLADCRTLVRQHAVLGLPLLALSPGRPAWPLWLAAILLGAAWGEGLARRPGLPLPVFCAGYTLDVLGYSAGRWLSRGAAWFAPAVRSP